MFFCLSQTKEKLPFMAGMFIAALLIFPPISANANHFYLAANQESKYPELQGEFFSDDTGKVDLATRRQISREMRNTLQDSKVHVVLACIKTTKDYPEVDQDFEKFTLAVAKHWELGGAKSKLGILVLFAIEDRKFFVAKTDDMSTKLTDEIKEGMLGLPKKALQQNNISLAMKRAANVLVELVPSYDSANGAKNIVAPKTKNTAKKPTTTNRSTTRKPPPTRVIRRESNHAERNDHGGGIGVGVAGLVCVGMAGLMIVMSVAGIGMAAARGIGGRRHYGGGGYYGGGGGGFLSGMLTGGLLGTMFGGSNHGWGSGYHHEEHHHHYDGGGGHDGGGGYYGGGFDYIEDTFGGGDFDGGSMGEW